MGQVLSNIVEFICICNEADREENPIIAPPVCPSSTIKSPVTSPESPASGDSPAELPIPPSNPDSLSSNDYTTDRLDAAKPGESGFDGVEEEERFFRLITQLMNSIGDTNLQPGRTNLDRDRLIFPADELQEEVLSCSPRSDSVSYDSVSSEGIDIEHLIISKSIGGGFSDPVADSGSGFGEEDKWLKHYSSKQRILLVGEGDFSFSASLAVAFGSAVNVVATSLDSEGFLRENYMNAMSNIHKLSSRGAKVLHGVDATKMATHSFLSGLEFDRIVFNFPHGGFFKNESTKCQLRRHRELVRLFMANAKEMIGRGGEIHITHKSNSFFREWKLEELGSSLGLQLIEEVPFGHFDYPGYRTKYGFGGDKNFNCYPCKTYKFQVKNCS